MRADASAIVGNVSPAPPRRPRRFSWGVVAGFVRVFIGLGLLALVAWPARQHAVVVWGGDATDSYAACMECGWNQDVTADDGFDWTYGGHIDDGPHVLPEILFGDRRNVTLTPLVGGG